MFCLSALLAWPCHKMLNVFAREDSDLQWTGIFSASPLTWIFMIHCPNLDVLEIQHLPKTP